MVRFTPVHSHRDPSPFDPFWLSSWHVYLCGSGASSSLCLPVVQVATSQNGVLGARDHVCISTSSGCRQAFDPRRPMCYVLQGSALSSCHNHFLSFSPITYFTWDTRIPTLLSAVPRPCWGCFPSSLFAPVKQAIIAFWNWRSKPRIFLPGYLSSIRRLRK